MKTIIKFLCALLILFAFSCSEETTFDPLPADKASSKNGKLKKNSENLSIEVIRAPIAPDGTSAGASTDIVLNFRDIDPHTDGIPIKEGGSIEVVLPEAFTRAEGVPNLGIILQGWPQSPPGPPPSFSITTIVGNTITVEMTKDYLVGGVDAPGPKQVHLALFGFRNPGPGMYPISLSITPNDGSDTQSGTGYVHIIPKARPAVSAVSLFSGGGPPPPFNNAIYQTVEQGQGNAANTVGLYLWESRRKALVGANIEMENSTHGRLVNSNGITAGQVRISPPPGASNYSLETDGPSTAGTAFLSGVDVGILKTTFIPDENVLGDYTIEFKMNNGNTQYLYVEVIPAI